MVSTQDSQHSSAADEIIVVGVDGFDPSLGALQWAIDHAPRGAVIEAIYVYEPPPMTSWSGGAPLILAPAPDTYRQAAVECLAHSVRRCTMRTDVAVSEVVAAGSPSRVLVHYASRASLLVVGAHDAHGLGRLLGSTAVGCVRHAPCPIVVVPAPSDRLDLEGADLVPATA